MSDKTKKKIDAKPIEDLAKILDDLNLTEISYTDGDFSVSVSKAAVAQTMSPTQTHNKNEQVENIIGANEKINDWENAFERIKSDQAIKFSFNGLKSLEVKNDSPKKPFQKLISFNALKLFI